MAPRNKSKSNASAVTQLTVTVFKDELKSRSFKIPLRLLDRLALLVGGLVLVTIVSVLLTVRFYSIARMSDPGYAIELERQISALKETKKNLEVVTTQVQAPEAPQLPVASITPSETPVTREQTVPKTDHLFEFFPAQTLSAKIPDQESLPFDISQPKATWSAKNLHVKFNIEYTAGDGRNQAGRIVIIARGNDRIIAYPAGAFQPKGAGAVLNPAQGEYFSVSRFRETKAKLVGFSAPSEVAEIQVLIFDTEKRLLDIQDIPPPIAGAAEQ